MPDFVCCEAIIKIVVIEVWLVVVFFTSLFQSLFDIGIKRDKKKLASSG